ncbi:SDR family NAD(P)-dependent oxidoreductase [Leucobacter chromiireducens]|uniref:SDR family NAD(P)-dependent oxidoreductase n=1 Tax=Leucobacter chromiireducens subsp. solipictus TaxID=398235 RepID=A0ABS1SKV4_9MICO|nr:SDR family NAD(P)-dependent oxidoreductase [Leucobacter chromiireducens]MBL3680099.1 SDR family NAD(P)-dependent oxidoreductase [Leucobacter chromiireducens subsp. solipictus]
MRGATVLITGAARGMGELYARRAAREGAAAIALWDVDTARADALAAELASTPATVRGGSAPRVRVFTVDVSDREAIRRGVADTRAELGDPDVLINNAGIVRGALFWEHDPEQDIERTMRINTLGPMWLTREVLPAMIADTSRPKRILNIASAAGTLANPRMSVYASSKWAMIGWAESVRLELAGEGHRHVAVTTFCPSFISTGMFAGARGPLLTPIMTPQRAVRDAWNGMLAGTPMVLRPWTVKLAMAFRGVLPTRAWDVVAGRVFRVYSSMDRFTGRA